MLERWERERERKTVDVKIWFSGIKLTFYQSLPRFTILIQYLILQLIEIIEHEGHKHAISPYLGQSIFQSPS